MQHLGQQPELVPVAAGVFAEREEVPARQLRLVAFAFGRFVVVAVALQGALRQVLAAGALGEATGVIVVFKVGLEVAMKRGFHSQTWLLEIVIAARDAAGAGFQTKAEDRKSTRLK